VGSREAGRLGQVVYPERLEVARVRQVLGAQEVAGWGDEGHATEYCEALPISGGGLGA
jgi:hypothetical protein